MSTAAAQMNANIDLWKTEIEALKTDFDQAKDAATIDRDRMVDDAKMKQALLMFQTALNKGVNLVKTIQTQVTSFKKDASLELAPTVNKAGQVWAKAVLTVQLGEDEARTAKDLYSGNDVMLPDTDHLYDNYSAVFPPQGFIFA